MEAMVKETINEKVAEVPGNPQKLRDFAGVNLKKFLQAQVNELMLEHRRLSLK